MVLHTPVAAYARSYTPVAAYARSYTPVRHTPICHTPVAAHARSHDPTLLDLRHRVGGGAAGDESHHSRRSRTRLSAMPSHVLHTRLSFTIAFHSLVSPRKRHIPRTRLSHVAKRHTRLTRERVADGSVAPTHPHRHVNLPLLSSHVRKPYTCVPIRCECEGRTTVAVKKCDDGAKPPFGCKPVRVRKGKYVSDTNPRSSGVPKVGVTPTHSVRCDGVVRECNTVSR